MIDLSNQPLSIAFTSTLYSQQFDCVLSVVNSIPSMTYLTNDTSITNATTLMPPLLLYLSHYQHKRPLKSI